jgi:hypothetical protein
MLAIPLPAPGRLISSPVSRDSAFDGVFAGVIDGPAC